MTLNSIKRRQRCWWYSEKTVTLGLSKLLAYVFTNWWGDGPYLDVSVSPDKSCLFDFYIPPVCHTIIWPTQTLTASHSRACLTERSSWTASSRQNSLETLACRSGGQVQSRPGWRSSWECPCTSEPAPKTSKVARYTSVDDCLLCETEFSLIFRRWNF